ncbi:E2 [Equus caballus papillomavirus 5]|uniref:Regulatory protein E2 n=1 Tax=Equus caballus papillomavirus 5 TaxID=1235429 RepID=K9M8S8_9PAPI|nr:E2 [Equus caballus papillomavirus 5]AFS89112.1 E2 [Equus caballus papillomavirus 5]
MAKLLGHLDAVTEKQMTLLEKGSTNLECHLEYWGLCRREAALCYAARQSGLQRVGPFGLPSLASSAAKAKEAIEMELHLTGLLNSAYSKEPWTLAECSQELFRTCPRDTFKKGGFLAEVIFDGKKENAMWYPGWSKVYFQLPDGTWERGEGGCDGSGLFYLEGQTKNYYTVFADDAARYSSTGTWQVTCRNETFSSPIVSSSSGGDSEEGGSGDRPDGQCRDPSTRWVGSISGNPRGLFEEESPDGGRRVAAAVWVPPKQQGQSAPPVHDGGDGGGGTPCSDPEPGVGGEGVLGDSSAPSTVQGTDAPDSSSTQTTPQTNPVASPARVKRVDVLDGRGNPIIPGAGGDVFLVVQGTATQLKSWRWRVHQHHRSLCSGISSTFWWTEGKRNGCSHKSARVLVTFKQPRQRTEFLRKVSMPRGMSAHACVL